MTRGLAVFSFSIILMFAPLNSLGETTGRITLVYHPENIRCECVSVLNTVAATKSQASGEGAIYCSTTETWPVTVYSDIKPIALGASYSAQDVADYKAKKLCWHLSQQELSSSE